MLLLQSSKLFRDLPSAELDFLAKVAQERRFACGQRIFQEGDPGDGVYVVKSGEVELSALVPQAKQHVFARLHEGDFFGEMAVLDREPRSASATAATDVELYFVPREPLLDLFARSSGLSLALLQEVSRRTREFTQRYVRELLQAERMALIGRFAGSIVHDLKNPLTIISIGAELMCMDSSTQQERHAVQQRLSRQIERITGMINEILEFTRGTTPATSLVPCDYADFARRVLEDLQKDLADKSVTLQLENVPASVRARIHPQRLSRVFANLVFNAVDEMPGGGSIVVRFEISDREVITELSDSGKGIAPEIQGTLFEPFTTHGKTKGTGLGLSICQRIVEEHGGRIWAQNNPGGGAVFAFTLPRIDAPADK